ncbi:Fungalysin metallopeptidase-domain-containing protein [Blastocladiella britannica]|nr:Fungalysin metallopeptidase-domain-containing protein [Blastocladiella britannica]
MGALSTGRKSPPLLLSALALIALVSLALAAPSSSSSVHTPQGQQEQRRGDRISFGPTLAHAIYSPSSSSSSSGAGFTSFSTTTATGAPIPQSVAESIALRYLADSTGVSVQQLRVESAHVSRISGTTHVYVRQVVHGVPVANGEANVNLDRNGMIISHGESLFRGPAPGHATHAAHQSNKENKHTSWIGSLWSSQQQQQHTFAAATPSHTPASGLAALLARLGRTGNSDNVWSEAVLEFTPSVSITNNRNTDTSHLGSFAAIPGLTTTDIPVSLAYMQTGDPADPLRLTYAYEVDTGDAWVVGHVAASLSSGSQTDDAASNVLSVVDYVSDFAPGGKSRHSTGGGSGRRPPVTPPPKAPKDGEARSARFRVFPLGVNDPEDGSRALVTDRMPVAGDDDTGAAARAFASPLGWVTLPALPGVPIPGNSLPTTSGNNVVAEDNPSGDASALMRSADAKHHRATASIDPVDGSAVFDFAIDLATQDPSQYVDAAVSQLFYTINALHDLFYAYGFDEIAGNFQTENLGRGGTGSDPVRAFAQDGSGFNNANFATPPDGKSGRMRMYVWNTAEPFRDGDLESGIVAHELGHGVSTRLTGGRMNSGCLGWGEAGGMGEGWGDTWATLIRMRNATAASRDFTTTPGTHVGTIGGWEMGRYANGGTGGIRKFPYSPDMAVNPSTYATLNNNGYWGVHAKGEVWALMLLEVMWNLVDDLGWAPLSNGPPPSPSPENHRRKKHHASSAAAMKPAVATWAGNTLFMQIIMDALKLQVCRPSFIDARNAIFDAEKVLTGGKHACAMWRAFAKRGLGVDVHRVPAKLPWEDDKRADGFALPEICQ